jgi:hypothetical protein
MNPQVFGTEHLIYIGASLLVAFAVFFCAKKFAKTEKAQTVFLKCAALVLFLIIFSNRLALVFEYDEIRWVKLLTDSFCSTSSYVLSLSILFGKRNNPVLHFIWLIALAGGTIVTFYSDFIGQNPSFFYPPTILGMLHHTMSAIVVVLMFMFGYVNLTYKKWHYTLFGFACYLAYGSFMYFVLKQGNPFYMAAPAVEGTPFTVWVIAPIYIAVYSAILLIVELVRRKRGAR